MNTRTALGIILIMVVLGIGFATYISHLTPVAPDANGVEPMPSREELLQQAWDDIQQANREPFREWKTYYLFRAYVKTQLAQTLEDTP